MKLASVFKTIIVMTAINLSGLPDTASAQTPSEVMKSYKAYNAAMAGKDFSYAVKHAKSAWNQAEKLMGDTATTGDLAYNYGYIAKNTGQNKKAIAALTRAADLAHLKKQDANLIRLEREVELVSALESSKNFLKAKKRTDIALDFASQNNLQNSVFSGELYVHKANACNRDIVAVIDRANTNTSIRLQSSELVDRVSKGKSNKCAVLAQKAVTAFETNAQEARPPYMAAAYNIVGYAKEKDKMWFEAAMQYQKSREILKPHLKREDKLLAQTIGRWLNARNAIRREGKLQEAEAKGLCRCWPFQSDRQTVKSVKRGHLTFPPKAYSSGYAIMMVDVDDAGKTHNIRILNSWPEDIFDRNSKKAVAQWEYEPKTGQEPADYRKDVTATISYYLLDQNGNPT